MKKKVFDLRLYTEALRQLRSFAVFSLLPLLFSACYFSLHTISYWASRYNTPELMNENLPIYRDAFALHPYLLHLCLLIAPLLTFRIFFFLNSRKGSDFYHAVPQNRLCLYGSFLAAVWTYLALLVFGSSLISGVCVAWIRPGFIAFRWPELLSFAAGAFCMSLYVSAAAACAAALSGTLFTAIITSLLIIFAPRLILYHLAQGIISTGKVLLQDHLFFLVDSRFHLPSVFILKSFQTSVSWRLPVYLTERSSDLSTFLSAPVQIYTVGITALLAGSGALIFVRRPSETAGLAAVSPRLNSAVGLLLSFLICLKTLLSAVEVLAGRRAYTISLWALVLPVFLLAVLVLSLYHLVSTSKLVSLKNALRSVPILLVMDLLFIGIPLLAGSAVNRFRPAAEEIESVRYLGSYNFLEDDADAFFQEETEKADLRSPFLKQLCAEGLQTILDADPEDDNYMHGGMSLKVAVRVNGKDHYRKIFASEENYQKLIEEFSQNESFMRCYKAFPDADDPRLTLDSTSIDRKMLPPLYQALLKDAAAASDADWYHLIKEETANRESAWEYLSIQFQENGEIKRLMLPITPHFPALWNAFWEAREQTARQYRPLLLTQLERLSRFPISGSSEYGIILSISRPGEEPDSQRVFLTNSNGAWLVNHSDPAEAILAELAKYLREEGAGPLDPSRPVTEIRLIAPLLETDGSSSQRCSLDTFFCADVSLLPALAPYFASVEEPQPIPVN